MLQKNSADNNLEYGYFLFGILLFELFGYLWKKVTLFQIDLEFIVNPIPVEIGFFLIELAFFFYVFRKPFLPNIKWIHLIIIGVLIEGLSMAEYLIRTYLLQAYFNYPFIENSNIGNILSNTRICLSIANTLLIIAYLWWHYHSANKNKEPEKSDMLSRCFYGGVLFNFTFGYILGFVNTIARQCSEIQNPLPLNIITNLIFLLLTVGAVYLLIKNRHRITIPLAIILIIVAINKISIYFLHDILNKCNLIVEKVSHADNYFSYVSLYYLFNFSFFIAVFILYRKAMKEASLKK